MIKIMKTIDRPKYEGNFYVQTPVGLWWLNGNADGWLEWMSTAARSILDRPEAKLHRLTAEDIIRPWVAAMIRSVEEHQYMFFDPFAQIEYNHSMLHRTKIVRMPYNDPN